MSAEFDIQIMKFAETELSPTEKAEVLARCEMEPERYRDLAIALVEHQRLADALVSAKLPSREAHRDRASSRKAYWPLATAAALAFVCGLGTSGYFFAQPIPQAANNGDEFEGSTVVYVEPLRTANPAAVHPIIDFPPQARQAMAQSLTPWFHPAEREALRQQGYELAEEPEVYMFDRGKDGKLVLPRRKLTLTAVSSP